MRLETLTIATEQMMLVRGGRSDLARKVKYLFGAPFVQVALVVRAPLSDVYDTIFQSPADRWSIVCLSVGIGKRRGITLNCATTPSQMRLAWSAAISICNYNYYYRSLPKSLSVVFFSISGLFIDNAFALQFHEAEMRTEIEQDKRWRWLWRFRSSLSSPSSSSSSLSTIVINHHYHLICHHYHRHNRHRLVLYWDHIVFKNVRSDSCSINYFDSLCY